MDDFNSQKICWPDISTQSAFCQINDFYYVTNTAYILVNGPEWLCEYLNSKIVNWYIKIIASGLGDNGSRFIKQFIVKIPIPSEYSKDFYQKLELSFDEINYLENSLS